MSTRAEFFRKKILGISMTPSAHLVETTWFRAAIALPVFLAIGVALFFTGEEKLLLDRSTEGMNNFLQMFKLPLGIAGLALPIVAIVAANHRSMQTAQQIKDQNSQNIFSNHLEHREFFAKFIEDRKPFGTLAVEPARLYEELFPEAVEGQLKPNLHLLIKVFSAITDCLITAQTVFREELTEKNFQLEKNAESVLLDEVRDTESIIQEKVFPIPTVNAEDLSYDPVATIHELKLRFGAIAEGLAKSANFHRYHCNEDSLYEIRELCSYIDDLREEILETYQFNQSIRLATDEYLDEFGSLRKLDGDTGAKFRLRLTDIHESRVKNNLPIAPLSEIFNYHLNPKHRLPLYFHSPEEWKPYMVLDKREQERFSLIKSTPRN